MTDGIDFDADLATAGMGDHPLTTWLDMAVPLEIARLREQGGPSDADWEQARSMAGTLASEADDLLYRSKIRGTSARLAGMVAFQLAVLAFAPGGVRIFGRHWEGQG